MGVTLIAAIWERGPEDSTEPYVLLAIPDNAADSGIAFPRVETVARQIRMGPRTVMRAIQSLEAHGWLKVNRKANDDGKASTYVVVRGRLQLPEWSDGWPPAARTQRNSSSDKLSGDIVSRDTSAESGAIGDIPPDLVLGRTIKNHKEPPRDASLEGVHFPLDAAVETIDAQPSVLEALIAIGRGYPSRIKLGGA